MKKKTFLSFLFKFLLLFFLLYFSFVTIIAVTAPGGYYSTFIDHYFNLIAWLKKSLIFGSGSLLKLFGYDTYTLDNFILRLSDGKGVRIAHDCAGHGIISFWAAYVISIDLNIKTKLFWLISGLFMLWFINILRISLLILALNFNWPIPLGIDHHTWFNIISYLFIFGMIFVIEKKLDDKPDSTKSEYSSKQKNN